MGGTIRSAMTIVALGVAAPGSASAKPAGRVSLSACVGKHPFDIVHGYRFLDHPAVPLEIAAR